MPVLADFLISELFVFLMVFFRLGSALMVMPGYGEIFVSTRARLLIALSISFVMMPLMKNYMPAFPTEVSVLVLLMIKETLTGFFIGFTARVLMSAMHSAATILATQSGLANALFFDFTQAGGQTTAVSNALTFAAIVMIFAADLHHVMLLAVIDSYELMPVDQMIPIADMAYMLANYLNKAFYIAFKLASPFIVMALIVNVGAGVLSRLMPNFQVFFVLMAPQIWITFLVLLIALPAMMLMFMNYMEDGLSTLLIGL